MQRKKFFLPLFFLSLPLAFLFVSIFSAKEISACEKVDICHATSSATNPYEKKDPDESADLAGHNGHGNDIIPPFSYEVWEVTGSHLACPNGYSASSQTCPGKCYLNSDSRDASKCVNKQSVNDYGWKTHQYPGKNWDTRGQSILNNNCVVPVCTDKTTTYSDWSVWTLDTELEKEVRSRDVTIVDKYDTTHDCGSTVETETRDIPPCEYTMEDEPQAWSPWSLFFENNFKEVKTRIIDILDQYNEHQWCDEKTETEYQDTPECKYITQEKSDWSEWKINESDTTEETRTRTVTNQDIVYEEADCGSSVEIQTRPVESCTLQEDAETIWTDWKVDPTDPTREYREGEIQIRDVNDSSIICDSRSVDPEYRKIVVPDDDEGEVLGEKDTVKGTTVVLASTGPSDNVMVYVMEFVLLASTLVFSVFFTKEYLKKTAN